MKDRIANNAMRHHFKTTRKTAKFLQLFWLFYLVLDFTKPSNSDKKHPKRCVNARFCIIFDLSFHWNASNYLSFYIINTVLTKSKGLNA